MSKEALIKLLVDDFMRMYPDAKHEEVVALRMKLYAFGVEDLELLCSQMEVVNG